MVKFLQIKFCVVIFIDVHIGYCLTVRCVGRMLRAFNFLIGGIFLKYIKPNAEILKFNLCDVITTSDVNIGPGYDGNKTNANLGD